MITIKKDTRRIDKKEFIEIQFDENYINYIRTIEYRDTKEIVCDIYYGSQGNLLTYDNCYDYLKENLNSFKEYICINQKCLVNEKRIAYTEKHDFGTVIYFIDGYCITVYN